MANNQTSCLSGEGTRWFAGETTIGETNCSYHKLYALCRSKGSSRCRTVAKVATAGWTHSTFLVKRSARVEVEVGKNEWERNEEGRFEIRSCDNALQHGVHVESWLSSGEFGHPDWEVAGKRHPRLVRESQRRDVVAQDRRVSSCRRQGIGLWSIRSTTLVGEGWGRATRYDGVQKRVVAA